MKLSKRLFKKRYLLFTALFLVLVIEFLLRIHYKEQLKTRVAPYIHQPDTLHAVDYIPGAKSRIITPGVDHEVTINSLGFMSPEFWQNKADTVFRIVNIGNSESTSLHINGDNTYSILLQELCHYYGLNVEVINCAHNGAHKDIQHLKFIENELIKYQPDLILFNTPENKRLFEERIYTYEYYNGYIMEYNPKTRDSRENCINIIEDIDHMWYLTMIYDASYIIRAFCKKYIEYSNPDWDPRLLFVRDKPLEKLLYAYITKEAKVPTPTYYYTYEKVLSKLELLKEKLEDRNINMVLFAFSEYDKDLTEIYTKKNINFIELKLTDRFSTLPVNSKLESHLNYIGHAIVAERLFSQLILNDLIPLDLRIKNQNNEK